MEGNQALMMDVMTKSGQRTVPQIFVGDVSVTTEIRSEEVTNAVSKFSAVAEIRAELLITQRKFIANAERGIVVEGRDIGTVVAPTASLKIYLYAEF